MSRSGAERSAIFPSHHAEALLRARHFGVPRSMIDAAGARRTVGDWRGACREAGFDVRLDLDDLRHRYGRQLVQELQDDLRHLAPDLLRWHLPRKAHDHGRLRAGLLIPLARYQSDESSLILTAFTAAPALAAGERVLLAVLPMTTDGDPVYRPDGQLESRSEGGLGNRFGGRPGRRFGGRFGGRLDGGLGLTGSLRWRQAQRYRLDRHRFAWDARAAALLSELCDREADTPITQLQDQGRAEEAWAAAGITFIAETPGRDRRAGPNLRRVTGTPVNLPALVTEARKAFPGSDRVALALGDGWAIVLTGLTNAPDLINAAGTSVSARCVDTAAAAGIPVLPQIAWTRPIDAELLRLRHLSAERLHPLVAAALQPRRDLAQVDGPLVQDHPREEITIRCGGSEHRLERHETGWRAANHSKDQTHREMRFQLLGGPPAGCLDEIARLTAHPELADHVDCYLQHGQIEAAQALVRQRLGSAAVLSDITLPDGTPAAEAVIRLDEALLRYRLMLSGVQPWPTRRPSRFIGFAEPFSSRPRPPRKGAATKQTQVIR